MFHWLISWWKKPLVDESAPPSSDLGYSRVKHVYRVYVDFSKYGSDLAEELRQWGGYTDASAVLVKGMDLLHQVKHLEGLDHRIAVIDNKTGLVVNEIYGIKHHLEFGAPIINASVDKEEQKKESSNG